MDEKKTTSKPLAALFLKGAKVLGVLAAAATIWGVFNAISTDRLKLGQSIGESQALAQLAETKGSITELRVELKLKDALTKSKTDENNRLRREKQEVQRQLFRLERQPTALSDSAGETDNCKFVRQQIQKTEQKIDNWVPTSMSHSEAEAEEKADKAILERRLRGYQQQLNTCQP